MNKNFLFMALTISTAIVGMDKSAEFAQLIADVNAQTLTLTQATDSWLKNIWEELESESSRANAHVYLQEKIAGYETILKNPVAPSEDKKQYELNIYIKAQGVHRLFALQKALALLRLVELDKSIADNKK